MKTVLFATILFLACSCVKYSQPSEPKLSGEWQIDRVEYYRIENGDTLTTLVYLPGDLYVHPNINSPLDSIAVGFTRFHMDNACIRFNPVQGYGGRTNWLEEYFYNVTEVSHTCPGFLKFGYGSSNCVWKVKSSSFYYTSLSFELMGGWDPDTWGFYSTQTADSYDNVIISCSYLGP
jgi:hypothetical protein